MNKPSPGDFVGDLRVEKMGFKSSRGEVVQSYQAQGGTFAVHYDTSPGIIWYYSEADENVTWYRVEEKKEEQP